MKVAGIIVGKNMKMFTTSLQEEKELKFGNLLNMWKALNLTIKGKITFFLDQKCCLFSCM